MAITVRQSAPPPPPPPFNPGVIPKGMEGAARQQQQLEEEHVRMKPQEPPTVMGDRQGALPPPVNPGGINAPAPYVYQAWPAHRWHRTKAPDGVIVKDAAEEAIKCTGEGWQDKPFPRELGISSTEQRLEMLDGIVLILADYAEDDETPEQTLLRCLEERDQFARKLAKGEQGNGPKTK